MIEINENTMKDIVQWDFMNWTRAINNWKINEEDIIGKKALGLGEAKGGLSLYFALHEGIVICSDFQYSMSKNQKVARMLHKKYRVDERITYEDIDATNIPYDNEFDIIFFKSILGGIGRNCNNELILKAFDQMYKALKPGGRIFFVENLKGTRLLQCFRYRYSKAYKNGWNYLDEVFFQNIEGKYKIIEYDTFGCIACIGPNEMIRHFLSYFDLILEKIVKERYIVSCVLEKI